MKNISLIFLVIVCATAFISCDSSNDNPDTELTIQEKVALLEGSEWLVKGFEDRVMHTFENGKRLTYYGADGEFGEAIPGTQDYSISENLLMIDFNFGNIKTFSVEYSCDDTIVEFFEDGELNTTLFKRNSDYEKCLNISL